MDDDDDGEDDAGGRRSGSMRSAKNAGAKQGRLKDSGDEPMDLLGKGASRELMRARGGRKVQSAERGSVFTFLLTLACVFLCVSVCVCVL